MDTARSQTAARELRAWFDEVLSLTDEGLFGIVPEGAHRGAVILDVMARNARTIADAQIDKEGKLYTPLCLLLAAGCRKLRVSLGIGHWRAAVENVLQLREQMEAPAKSTSVALDLGGPTALFLQQLREAIIQAGLAGTPSYLDKENREIALGLAINWGMRFLVAYALDCTPPSQASGRKDLAWIADILSPVPS